MKVSNKTNLAAGIVLLLLAAFFSIALLLQPLDFGQFGPGHENFLYILGSMLTSVYGFTSILIPLFLFAAAISCFATNWTARKSMRLLTAIIPFFTSFAGEKLIKFFLKGENFIPLKITVTIIVTVMLIIIEFLLAGIIADKISTPIITKDDENDFPNSSDEETLEAKSVSDDNKNSENPYFQTESVLDQNTQKTAAISEENSNSQDNTEFKANTENEVSLNYESPMTRFRKWITSKKEDSKTEKDESDSIKTESYALKTEPILSKKNDEDPFKDVFDDVKNTSSESEKEEISTEEIQPEEYSQKLNQPQTEKVQEEIITEKTAGNDDEDNSNPASIITQEEYAALTGFGEESEKDELEWPDAEEIKAKAGNTSGDTSDFDEDPYSLADLNYNPETKTEVQTKKDETVSEKNNDEIENQSEFENISQDELIESENKNNSTSEESIFSDSEDVFTFEDESSSDSEEMQTEINEGNTIAADESESNDISDNDDIFSFGEDDSENESIINEADDIFSEEEKKALNSENARNENFYSDNNPDDSEINFPEEEIIEDEDEFYKPEPKRRNLSEELFDEEDEEDDEEEIPIFGQLSNEKDDSTTLESDFEDSINQYDNIIENENNAVDERIPEEEVIISDDTENDTKKIEDAINNADSDFFDVDLNERIPEETIFQENFDDEESEIENPVSDNYLSPSDVVRIQKQEQEEKKSSLSSEIFEDMEDDIRKEVKKEMLYKKYGAPQNLEEDSDNQEENIEASENEEEFTDSKENEISVPVVKQNNTNAETNKIISHRATAKKPYSVPTNLLQHYDDDQYWLIDEETKQNATKLMNTLTDFGISAEVISIKKGPVVTMYELEPAPGVRLSKIVSLQDNIALSLAASSVRIVAPIPGRAAVGIEVPNKKRSIVSFREMIEQDLPEFKKMAVPVVLGKDILGKSQIIDIAKTPHLLIAGATGAGKSVCVNSIILSILYKRSPQQVKMILVDPKVVELKLYNDIPHLLTPVITEPKKALQALHWCLCEMERRYALLDQMGVRDISSYNNRVEERNICTEKLPYIVIIIDEFADLMATSGKELESNVARLAAMSRAVGIHLVLATQRPSVNVITGLIKANIPSRIAFMVASRTDSNIIIDSVGAEKLLGKGDMLYASAVDPYPVRIQGTFESDNDVENVVNYVKTLGEPDYIDDEMFIEEEEDEMTPSMFNEGSDPLYEQAVDIVIQAGKASASYIQRRLKIGYNRAARLVEEMEERGIVGPANGSKPREIIHMPN